MTSILTYIYSICLSCAITGLIMKKRHTSELYGVFMMSGADDYSAAGASCCFGSGSFCCGSCCRKLSVEVGGLCLLYGLGSDARRTLDEVAGHEKYAEDTQYGQCSGKIPCCFSMKSFVRRTPITWLHAELRGEATAFSTSG